MYSATEGREQEGHTSIPTSSAASGGVHQITRVQRDLGGAKMLTKAFVTTAFVLVTTATSAFADDPTKIASEMTAQYVEAFNSKNAEKIASMFLPDGTYVNQNGSFKGHAAIKAALEGAFKAGFTHLTSTVKGAWGNGDVVGDYGSHQITGANAKGPVAGQGEWSAVLVKVADGWRVAVLAGVAQPKKK